ncbi:hypothetical protein ThvES_00020550, partial [Thiovulum sp. ES]
GRVEVEVVDLKKGEKGKGDFFPEDGKRDDFDLGKWKKRDNIRKQEGIFALLFLLGLWNAG